VKSQTISKETVEQLAREKKPLFSVERAQIDYVVNGKPQVAVGDASFEVFPGEKIMLLGPSGCDKSALLKAVAGFLENFAGEIKMASKDTLASGPDRAVVFQEFDQLFPRKVVHYRARASLRGRSGYRPSQFCEQRPEFLRWGEDGVGASDSEVLIEERLAQNLHGSKPHKTLSVLVCDIPRRIGAAAPC
jgi:ATPase subunit of ABC transporter with duplicated ATPase domains